MANEDAGEVEGGGGADAAPAGGAAKKRKLAGRTLVLFVVLPILLIGGAGAGAYVSGMLDMTETEQAAEIIRPPSSFFDMPELVVNLSGRDGDRSQFLKLKVSLEFLDKEAEAAVDPILPRIMDLFQVYLRELRPRDLEGSAGMFRLKEELIRRVNLEISPHEIADVLFKEIIVQ